MTGYVCSYPTEPQFPSKVGNGGEKLVDTESAGFLADYLGHLFDQLWYTCYFYSFFFRWDSCPELAFMFHEHPYPMGELKIVAFPIKKPWIPRIPVRFYPYCVICSRGPGTFCLNKRRNSQSSVLEKIILCPFHVRCDPVPGNGVSNWINKIAASQPIFPS